MFSDIAKWQTHLIKILWKKNLRLLAQEYKISVSPALVFIDQDIVQQEVININKNIKTK